MVRIARLLGLGLALTLVLAGCSLLGLGKGNISFYGTPGYDDINEELYFAAAFERDGLRGSEVVIEYEILRGSTSLTYGSAEAGTFDESIGSWVTNDIRVPLAQSEYSGRTITIALDPEEKLTSSTVLIDNREETVEIP